MDRSAGQPGSKEVPEAAKGNSQSPIDARFNFEGNAKGLAAAPDPTDDDSSYPADLARQPQHLDDSVGQGS
jgi:hypothetical protein